MDSYSSSSRHSSSSPTNSRGSSVKSSSGHAQNLLAPVVRSKRTPIACTECRRRQVKCTGTTPKCERCEKRGMKCEYIPCSQQKAASNDSPPPQSLPTTGAHTPPSRPYSTEQYPSQQWQQPGIPFDSSYAPYSQQPVDWQSHPSQRSSMLQQQRYGAHGVHAQPLDASPYNQSAYSHQQSYNMMPTASGSSYAQRPIVPSQQYASMAMQNGYMAPEVPLGNSSLNYPSYTGAAQPLGSSYGLASTQTYTGEYYHADTDTFDPTAVGMVSSDPSSHYGDLQHRPF